MFHPDFRRMAMHVTKETFLTAVLHFDRLSSAQSKQTAVHLQADVLTSAEGATDAS
jgi:hypothetical protein